MVSMDHAGRELGKAGALDVDAFDRVDGVVICGLLSSQRNVRLVVYLDDDVIYLVLLDNQCELHDVVV